MGSSSSKEQSKKDILHIMSLPVDRSRLESPTVVWKSRLSSLPKVAGREISAGGFFGISSTLQQVSEDDLDSLEPRQDHGWTVPKNEKSFSRTVSFQPTRNSSPLLKCLSSRKLLKNEMPGMDGTWSLNMKLESGLDSLSQRELVMESNAGLRSLLSPVLKPSRGFASPTRPAYDPYKALASTRSFRPPIDEKSRFITMPSSDRGVPLGDNVQSTLEESPDKRRFSARSTSSCEMPMFEDSQVKQDVIGGADATEGSPRFDSFILATFEKALDCLSDGSHYISDSVTNDNSSSVWESESSSDSEVLAQPHECMESFQHCDSVACQNGKVSNCSPTLCGNAFLSRKLCFSRNFSLRSNESWSGKDYLQRFEMICPPSGENKVVLYFTSLRAVRKTFEDCCMLRSILKGLRIHVDERDVWMHSNFRKELTEVMAAAVSVPRLFILGRYIGGAEEIEQLHEDGILGKMLEGLAKDLRQECEICMDVRFIPCTTCFGSCKFVSEEDVIERCPECNENGLIMCPYCSW